MRQEVKVFIDPRATDNFIYKPLMDESSLHYNVIPPYKVTFGDKHSIQCDYICREVLVNI